MKSGYAPIPKVSSEKEPSAVSSEPSLHLPIHASHLKHAVVGKKIHVAIKGTVKGVRQRHDGTHEVEVQPTHSRAAPGGGSDNRFADLAEDGDEDDAEVKDLLKSGAKS